MFKDTLRSEGELVLDNWKPLTVRCTRDNVRVELNPDKITGNWEVTAEHVKVRDDWLFIIESLLLGLCTFFFTRRVIQTLSRR